MAAVHQAMGPAVAVMELAAEVGLLAMIFDKAFISFFTLKRNTQGRSRLGKIRLGLGSSLRSS